MAEHSTVNRTVAGSSPAAGAVIHLKGVFFTLIVYYFFNFLTLQQLYFDVL